MCKSTNLSDLAAGGFPPPQLNRLIICRAWCCHREPHGYQISPDTTGKLLLMITALLLLMEIFTQRREENSHARAVLQHAAPCIYLHCKGADLTAFQFNCTWYCCVHVMWRKPSDAAQYLKRLQKRTACSDAVHPRDGQIIEDFDNQYGKKDEEK